MNILDIDTFVTNCNNTSDVKYEKYNKWPFYSRYLDTKTIEDQDKIILKEANYSINTQDVSSLSELVYFLIVV